MRGYIGDFEQRSREEIRNKWSGLTVVNNGTDQTATVAYAWPLDNGSIGLWLVLEDGSEFKGDSERWTVVRSKKDKKNG